MTGLLNLAALGLALGIATSSSAYAEYIAAWETTGQAGWGVDALPSTSPSYNDSHVTTVGLTRGSGVVTTGTATTNAWGGTGWDGAATAEEAVTAGNFITFAITPASGYEISASSFKLHYRRSTSGPNQGVLQAQVGAGAFTDVATLDFSTSSDAGTDALADLTTATSLQNVSGQTVTFRIVPFGATNSGGTFYIYGPPNGFDLIVDGAVKTVGSGPEDTRPPLVASLLPADDATSISVDAASTLKMNFNEDIVTGAGSILVKEAAGGTVVATVDVSAGPPAVDVLGNQLTVTLPTPLAVGTSYYVEVPAGAILDTATPANAFAGISGATGWNFTTASFAGLPTVVINKYFNSGVTAGANDVVELLVVATDSTPTLDLRGMILKDFSGSMAGDNGGRYQFSTDNLWSAVPKGTLIVLTVAAPSPDIDPSDFKLNVGLNDGTYFQKIGSGTFDIAGVEMVMIKAAGSDPGGSVGGIHALAAGNADVQFTNFTGPKVRAAASTTTGNGVFVNNGTGTLTDFLSGAGATGATPMTAASFGVPSNGTNASYIAFLRGVTPGDGDGLATILNATSGSPYSGHAIFGKGLTGQSAKVVLSAQIPGATITNLKISVPAALGTPGATATLGGAGGTSATAVVSGQDITISGAAVTTTDPIEVTLTGLSTPTPSLATDNGSYAFTVSTATASGNLAALATQPALHVITPISSFRDVDANGASLDLGTLVAIEGVVTEENFGTSNNQSFIQDTTAGINVFLSTNLDTPLVRGTRYAVLGTVTQFNGLTELVPVSQAEIVNLGADTEPAPVVVTLADLFANAEAYEGKLVTVNNLTYVSGAWGAGSTVTLADSTSTNIDIRIQGGSTATTEPAYPVNITGIIGQFDSSIPYTASYQLMPRDPADLTPGTGGGTGYADWATANNVTGGIDGDSDQDGIKNLIEYALSLNPAAADGSAGTLSAGTVSFTKRALAVTNGDVTYAIQTSPDLSTWTNLTAGAPGYTNNATTISYLLPTGQTKIFTRLVVTQN